MGVKDLWTLLSVVGRTVSMESLQGKVLAVDMSIWLIQFLKAMRTEDGNIMKNAHILGTLRRILKLLFHRIKPIFVFDGETPTLKYQTVLKRRKLRARQEENYTKAAQKVRNTFIIEILPPNTLIMNMITDLNLDTNFSSQASNAISPFEA
jgi:DNA excision repair protein ERCC-5